MIRRCTAEEVAHILRDDRPNGAIASDYGLSDQTISKIRTGRSYGAVAPHIARVKRNGRGLSALEALERRSRPGEFGCRLWLGATTPNGYGVVVVEGQRWLVHRLSFRLAYGPIPAGLCVLHHCDTRNCWESSHLFLGTRPANTADMVAKRRQRQGEGRPDHKLTEDDVRAIRAAHGSLSKIGADFAISPSVVWHVKHGRAWKHVV